MTKNQTNIIDDCIHCGLCLSACPTYLVTGLESENPRGRIMLMMDLSGHDHLQNQDSQKDDFIYSRLDSCLDCRACLTACPSGVEYASLLEMTREVQERKSTNNHYIRKLILSLVTNRSILSILQFFGWIATKAGLFKLLKRVIPVMAGVPELPFQPFMKTAQRVYPAIGEKQGDVAFFAGCVMENLYPDIHRATIRILNWNGFEVHVPKKQTCCGALHHHSSGREFLPSLQYDNVNAFKSFDTILINSAGCGAELKDYPQEDFAVKVKDISEFLTVMELKVPDNISKPSHSMIWDSPCHLIHGQAISKEPTDILRKFGVQLMEFPQSHICCGAAGSYAITQSESSEAILKMKMNDIERTGAETVVTSNPGCQIQIQKGIDKYLPNLEVKHICEILDILYRQDSDYVKTFKL